MKPEPVFEFAEKPRITREGDKVTIAFASKGWCDVTVAIENAAGRIVRHLASGVLGENAPEPFQWNAKKQTLMWDGKDDQGVYVDDKDRITVRVSLGLKPQFEKSLMWEPKRRVGQAAPLIQATSEGVYVYDADLLTEHLRLFDHRGAYVRTLFPFPASQLDKVEGLLRRPSELDGRPVPVKPDRPLQSHLLTTGLIRDAMNLEAGGGSQDERLIGVALAMVAMGGKDGRIALVNDGLNRLSPDGSTGGFTLTGPRTAVPVQQGGEGGKPIEVGPSSAALSPDGKWLYLTGYQWKQMGHYAQKEWLHGVTRMAFDGKTPPEVFAGSMKQGNDQAGPEPSRFKVPTGVACDNQGRVYVADHVNDRIQVFQADGKFLKEIPVTKPVWVAIHHETQEIYVGSWAVSSAFVDWRKPPVSTPTIDLAFDLDGMAYLRRPELVVRYDSRTWREVPWDYGEDRQGPDVKAVAGLPVPVVGFKTQGGMSISPKGYLAVACRCDEQGPNPMQRAGMMSLAERTAGVKPYRPKLYPGRLTSSSSTVHVFDQHGRLVHEDTVPGLSFGCQGVWIDASDNLYVLASGTPVSASRGNARSICTPAPSCRSPVTIPSPSWTPTGT